MAKAGDGATAQAEAAASASSSSSMEPYEEFIDFKMEMRSAECVQGRLEILPVRNWNERRLCAHHISTSSSSVSSHPNMEGNGTWQKLSIPNERGEKLVGILDDTLSPHVVVLCHGFRSSKEDAVLINLTSTFLTLGLSTFRFDFSGSGESEGHFHYGSYWKDAGDLRCVVTYLRGQGRKVEILVGHSKGGNAVLLYASKYKDVDTLVNISGRFHLKRGIKKRLGNDYLQVIEKHGYVDVKDRYGNFEYRVTKESLKDRLSTNMETALGSIPSSCRVLTVHGSKDETVSCEEAKDFDRLISNHTLCIIDDADHYYRQHQRALAFIVAKFVKDCFTSSGHDKTQQNFSKTHFFPSARL